MNDSFYTLPNEVGSLLISNLSIDNGGYSWKGSVSQLKSFVRNDLNLPGSWSSPGGDRKVFRDFLNCTNIFFYCLIVSIFFLIKYNPLREFFLFKLIISLLKCLCKNFLKLFWCTIFFPARFLFFLVSPPPPPITFPMVCPLMHRDRYYAMV